jgi:hypothetical protein
MTFLDKRSGSAEREIEVPGVRITWSRPESMPGRFVDKYPDLG